MWATPQDNWLGFLKKKKLITKEKKKYDGMQKVLD